MSFSDGLEAGIIGLHLERHLDKGADNISRARWEKVYSLHHIQWGMGTEMVAQGLKTYLEVEG